MNRSRAFSGVIGVAMGALLTGLVLPWVIDEEPTSAVATNAPVGTTAAGEPLDMADGPADPNQPQAATDATDAAPQGSGTAGTSATVPATAAAAGGPTPGVTDDAIEVGIVLLDLGGIGAFMPGADGLSPREQENGFQASIDAINEKGGINGRRIDPYYRTMDPVQADQMREVCIEMARDRKVFAVLNMAGFVGTASLCLTEEHGVPYVFFDGEPDEWYARSKGLMFSIPGSKSRVARNWVHELHRTGALQGKKIGVVSVDFETDELAVERSLLPTLAELGYEVTHRSHLARDLQTAASQTPVEVQQMRVKGVEIVLLTAGFTYAIPFVQEADAQMWRPVWTASDFAGNASNLATSGMPPSYENALGFTGYRTGEGRAGMPEPPADVECRRRYEELTGQQLDRNSGLYSTAMSTCNLVNVFAAGAERGGRALTRQGFSAGMQTIGTTTLANAGFGSYRPGKFDAIDQVRTVRWRANCRCWVPADDFRSTTK